ncbi:hypothetical protein NDU88_002389 [Pleurodeles waltl]|uniref:Uncharacterized protein n=1 Tax=Pleurodeles waltl TaxID=8319 RepID=A0AAV7M3S4_PLEWA|nr:hypothetical protein NDU88_002389 [Pleurodeles waltl]
MVQCGSPWSPSQSSAVFPGSSEMLSSNDPRFTSAQQSEAGCAASGGPIEPRPQAHPLGLYGILPQFLAAWAGARILGFSQRHHLGDRYPIPSPL